MICAASLLPTSLNTVANFEIFSIYPHFSACGISIEPSLTSSGDEGCVEKSAKAKPYEKEFNQLWSVYPRRVGMAAAYKQVAARLKAGVSFEDLWEATIKYAEIRRNQPAEYTKHASTFYGPSEHWKDYLASGAAVAEQQAASQPAIFGALARFLDKD